MSAGLLGNLALPFFMLQGCTSAGHKTSMLSPASGLYTWLPTLPMHKAATAGEKKIHSELLI